MKTKEDKKRFHKGEFSIQSIIMSVLSAVTLVTIVLWAFCFIIGSADDG